MPPAPLAARPADSDRVRITEEDVLAHNWGVLKKTSFELKRNDGSWQKQVRETYDRGPAAAILLHCPETATVVLVRQFRFPVYAQGKPAWILEACAGLLDGDDPETCARREAEEEAGIRVLDAKVAFTAEMSPGSVIETVTCLVGTYGPESRISAGGGLHDEGEDIEVVELPVAEALGMIRDGRIIDAKTIMLIQHLVLTSYPGLLNR